LLGGIKCDDFWRHRVDAYIGRARGYILRQAVDRIGLLGRGKLHPGDTIDGEQSRAFFDETVNSTRDATAGAAPPSEFSISSAHVCNFRRSTNCQPMT
jgi:hypothetical protein